MLLSPVKHPGWPVGGSDYAIKRFNDHSCELAALCISGYGEESTALEDAVSGQRAEFDSCPRNEKKSACDHITYLRYVVSLLLTTILNEGDAAGS